MALGTEVRRQSRKWLTIHHGIVELSENGQKSQFSYVEGRLVSIYTKQRTYGGENVTKWFIDIADEDGTLYTVSFPYYSGTFKSIVLALVSDNTLCGGSMVRIEPYQKGNFTNVTVWSDGVKLDWMTKELPPIEEVKVGDRIYKDETKRMAFIASIVNKLNQRLSVKNKGGYGSIDI